MNGAVAAPTGDRPSIRTERYASDPIRMPLEGLLVGASHRIPQVNGYVGVVVVGPDSDRSAIRTIRYAIDEFRMPLETPSVCARDRITQVDVSVTINTCESYSPSGLNATLTA